VNDRRPLLRIYPPLPPTLLDVLVAAVDSHYDGTAAVDMNEYPESVVVWAPEDGA
jgi:hypothetical protein